MKTPEEKAAKTARRNLHTIHTRIRIAWTSGNIKSWADVFKYFGFTDKQIAEQSKTGGITYPELKKYLEKQTEELERKLNEPKTEETNQSAVEQPTEGVSTVSKGVEAIAEILHPETEQSRTASVEQHRVKSTDNVITSYGEIPYINVQRPAVDDWNDCTVLAFSVVSGLSYEKASRAIAEEGRKRGRGLRGDWLSEFLRAVGFELVNEDVNLSLIDTVNMCRSGKYFVYSKSHAFAIIDGTIYDHSKPEENIKVVRVYKYTGVPLVVPEVLPKKEETAPQHTADDNYGLCDCSRQRAFLYWFQKKAAAEILEKMMKGYRGILLLAPTGVGKTFIVAAIDCRLIEMNYHEGKTFSHIPRLYITKSTILEQTGRVFENQFGIQPNVETEIINIEQLRSKSGQLWIREKIKIEQGEEKAYVEWKNLIQPCVIYLDESQGVKNKKAKRSQIIHAYNNLPANTCLISISATPFTRVSEAQAFAVSTHRPIDHLGFPAGSVLTNETWPAYASIIAHPSSPDEYNEAAVKRLMDDLEDYVVRVRGVRPQYDANNIVNLIPFESDEKRKFYETAYERFLKEKAKLDAAVEAGDTTGACYLVILLKFAMAAEMCHAEYWARKMYEDVSSGRHAAVCAVKFKQTLIEIVKILHYKYGVSRDEISLVWGGGQTKLTKKQEAKAKAKAMSEKLKALGIEVDELIQDMGLEDVEDRVIEDLPEHLRLGMQSKDSRQEEIDRFQSGKSLYCIYTLKAGGVGLSLHHTDELTTRWNDQAPGYDEWIKKIEAWNKHRAEEKKVKPGKCRRKESGYAFEEDIPFIPIRPRKTYVTVTYNAIELVQGIGRVPRLTSLSVTDQELSCYLGTVEVDMAKIYTAKLRCLSAVVKQRESWQDVMLGSNRQRIVEEIQTKTANIQNDESSLIDEGEIEEEEDNNGNGEEK